MISTIVDQINATLRLAFGTTPNRVFGIAEPIILNDETAEGEPLFIPVIIDGLEDQQYVFFDELYQIGIYHRLLGKTYERQPTKGYGDSTKVIVKVDMGLVCWGYIPGIKAEQLEHLIYAKAPASMQFISTNFDRKQVFNQEMPGAEFMVPPELYLFYIKYRVQYPANNACLEINDILNV